MATVDELMGVEVDDILVIDWDSRKIIIPSSVTNIGVSSDDKTKRLKFKMPRYYDDLDLSKFEIRVNYMNALMGGDMYKVKDITVSEEEIYFNWRIGRFAMVYKGDVRFNVCLKKISGSGENAVVEEELNTEVTKLPVLEGLETLEQITQKYPDLVEVWQEELFGRFHGRVDDTLSVEGRAADAAVTGKRLSTKAEQADLASERARIDALVSSATPTSETELIDIRTDFNSVVHDSAGTAVRESIKTMNRIKQRQYGSFAVMEGTLHTDVVYQVESKSEQAQTNGFYGEYDVTGETMLLVSGYSWSSFSVFPLGAFYDADGKLIKKIGHTWSGNHNDYLFIVPYNAAKLVVNGKAWAEPGVKRFVAGDLENDILKIQNTIAAQIVSSKLKDYTELNVVSEAISLSADNTELLEEQMYTSDGKLTTGVLETATYDTIYFPVGTYEAFNLELYAIGVYGGAFVDSDKNWISSFGTDYPNNMEDKIVPENAHYIAITVHSTGRYATITGMRKTYELKGLQILDKNLRTEWFGKKIVWIGTSVSFGQYATKAYPHEAAQKLGFELVNCSVPGLAIHTNDDGSQLTYGSLVLSKAEYADQGKTIPNEPIAYSPGGSYNDYYRTYENIFTEDNADADLYVFDVAPNNSDFSTTDWDAFDFSNWQYSDGSDFSEHRTTFLGALLFLMDKMYELNENARMVFVLGSGFAYWEGKTALQKVKDKWNIPIIDLWGKINTTPKSITKIFSENGTNPHPSTYAHELMGKMLTHEIKGIC